jgi:predicted permease
VGSPPIQHDFSRPTNTLFGKLKTGVSRAAGEAELTSLTRALIRSQPRSFQDGERIQSEAVQEAMIYRVARSPVMAIFITMILLILLSACANLGNMLLARGLVRQREIDIRVAVGAGRGRMLRQLMTENLLLATLGTAAGLAFGAASAHLLLREVNAPPSIHLTMSWPIFAAGAALTCISTLAFGLPSAWQTVRASHRKVSLRQNLVGVQVAVSCLLLISSGVLAHKGIASAAVNVAFDYRNMIVIDPQLYARNLPVPIVREKLDTLTARLKALPGVQGVTAAVAPPLGGRVLIESLPGLPRIYRDAVAPSYFSVMQLPIMRGRTFYEGERNAVIVSESAARAIWPDGDAVGKIWKFAGASRTVMGIAKDSGANLIGDPDSIEAYTPIESPEIAGSALIVHSRTDPALFARMLPATLQEAVSVSLLRSFRDNFIEGQNKFITLIGSVGALATVLAAAGMFALVGFAVAQRKRELGIRIAIGAKRHHILETLLLQNVTPTIAGAIAGVILAAIFSRVLRSFILLPNGGAVDVIGFAGGLAFFTLVAALATLTPAMRALRIERNRDSYVRINSALSSSLITARFASRFGKEIRI